MRCNTVDKREWKENSIKVIKNIVKMYSNFNDFVNRMNSTIVQKRYNSDSA